MNVGDGRVAGGSVARRSCSAACSSGSSSSTTTTIAPTTTSTSDAGTASTSSSGPPPPPPASVRRRAPPTALSVGIWREQWCGRHHRDDRGSEEHRGPPCVLGGYPGLQPARLRRLRPPDQRGAQGQLQLHRHGPDHGDLAAGQSVYFNIGYSDVPVGNETSCPDLGLSRDDAAQRLTPSDRGGHPRPLRGRDHGGVAGRSSPTRLGQTRHRPRHRPG